MSEQKSRAPKAQGAYPPAKRVGNLLFVSGQGSRDPETDELPGLIVDASAPGARHFWAGSAQGPPGPRWHL